MSDTCRYDIAQNGRYRTILLTLRVISYIPAMYHIFSKCFDSQDFLSHGSHLIFVKSCPLLVRVFMVKICLNVNKICFMPYSIILWILQTIFLLVTLRTILAIFPQVWDHITKTVFSKYFFCFLLQTPGCLVTCVFCVTNCGMPKRALVQLLHGQINLDIWRGKSDIEQWKTDIRHAVFLFWSNIEYQDG